MTKKRKRFSKQVQKLLKKSQRTFHLTARKLTLMIIVVAVLTVGLALLLGAIFNPEATTKREIEAMARDYYETYYYENFKVSEDDVAVFSEYTESGFAKTTLRQLLLFDGGRYKSAYERLTNYCDENATTVLFYPVEPYGAKNYRAEYNYSCNF